MSARVSKVFVSYSHDDSEWVRELFKKPVRTTHGIAVQSIDFRVLDPGVSFDDKLKSEIDQAAGFVFLVSSNFLKSKYVQKKEWKWIQENKSKDRICCIEIGKALSRDCEVESLGGYLKNIHRDTDARLPKTIPGSGDKLEKYVTAVHRSVARTLDPEGMKLVNRLRDRGLTNIEFFSPGSVANVYVASTPTFGRKLAIKVPHPDLTEKFLKTLKSAVQMARIPNVVGIYETNTENDPFYCITEFIDGKNLAHMLEEARKENNVISIDLVRKILLKLCLALKNAHENDISHLNIRPGNILVDSFGEPFLLPTGRVRDALSRQWDPTTLANMEPGEFNNAPPEFFGDKGWTEESADMYAIGLVGYWMIAGKAPDPVANRDAMRADPTVTPEFVVSPDLISLRPDCPVALARTVMRMIHPDPSHRYRSFAEMFDSLMRYPDANLAIAELSWRRCLQSDEDIFVRFYERFFADAKSAEDLFEKPWPTPRQKNLLRDAVVNLLQFYALKQSYRDIPMSLNPLEGLAQQHVGRNIENAHFQAFARALIETVIDIDPGTDSGLGDDDPIRNAWKAVVEPGALYMETRVAELNCASNG